MVIIEMIKIKSSRKKHEKLKHCQEILEHNLWQYEIGQIKTDTESYIRHGGSFKQHNENYEITKIVIAYVNNIPVGCAILTRYLPSVRYDSSARYLGVFVHPDFRMRGIGSRLAQKATVGISMAYVSDKGNGFSRPFYSKSIGNKMYMWKDVTAS